MKDLVSKYEVYLESIGKRKNTVSAYITDVYVFRFCRGKRNLR